ncbi:MAG: ATP-binding protein [Pyrobaculum sp.]
MRRKMPEFVSSVKTEFTDRDRALAQVAEWAEKSTRWPVVVFGPEDCGKTAFLRQVAEALRSLGTTSSTCICWIGSSRLRWTIRR